MCTGTTVHVEERAELCSCWLNYTTHEMESDSRSHFLCERFLYILL